MLIETDPNAMGARALRERLRKTEDFIEEARRVSGFDNFHSDSFQDGLKLLVEGITSSDVLSDYGFGYASDWVIAPLVERLKIDNWIAEHPDVTRAPVKKPVFLLGLPRTGTTILHALLGVDPRFRILWKWEVNNSVPPVKASGADKDARIAAARAQAENIKAAGQVAPHFVDADEPEECIHLMMQDMKSLAQEHVVDNQAYRTWLFERADMAAAYRNHKRALQLMQSDWRGRWMLKLPSHALSVDALLEIYPDACIVVPHRNPLVVAGSYVSLNSHLRKWVQRERTLDLHALGRQLYPQVVEHARRTMAYRNAHPRAPFLDVFYDVFKRDPLSEIRRIYEFIGEELTPEITQAMRDYIAAHPEQPYGQHKYELEDFGIEREKVLADFREYIERYDIKVR